MEKFKEASKQKLRFQTSKGLLSVEQLWDLSLNELDALAVALEVDVEESGRKSFLTKTSSKNKLAKLRFDLALDVLTSKQEELQAANEKAETKEHNKKIISLIAEKQDESLRNKSIPELEALLK